MSCFLYELVFHVSLTNQKGKTDKEYHSFMQNNMNSLECVQMRVKEIPNIEELI